MHNILVMILFITVITTTVLWSGEWDKKIQVQAEKYVECVKNQYQVSPDAYFEQHGEYPKCQVSSN